MARDSNGSRAAKEASGEAEKRTRGLGNDSARPEGRLGGVACLASSQREMPRATGDGRSVEVGMCPARADSSGGGPGGARQTPPLARREAGDRVMGSGRRSTVDGGLELAMRGGCVCCVSLLSHLRARPLLQCLLTGLAWPGPLRSTAPPRQAR
ncbi:hypothetical protein BKA80DRAFT_286152 [Phyllosticta citrichinensis]